MSTYDPELQSRPVSTRSRNTITCNICQAVYAPAQEYEYLLHAPPMALESAFMSMCHFCFRCRRPACPNCWDHVHGVCGICTLEANLPFRSQVTPLHGVVFPPMRQIRFNHKLASQTRFICIQSGRFQNTTPTASAKTPPIKPNTVQNTPHTATQNSSHQVRVVDTKMTQAQSTLPPVAPTATARIVAPSATINIDEIDTKPERHNHPTIDEIDTRPERHNRPTLTKPRPHRSLVRRIERIITILLFALLLFIVLLIVFAEVFQDANAIILQIAHIDIRAEIAYILQLIRQIFS